MEALCSCLRTFSEAIRGLPCYLQSLPLLYKVLTLRATQKLSSCLKSQNLKMSSSPSPSSTSAFAKATRRSIFTASKGQRSTSADLCPGAQGGVVPETFENGLTLPDTPCALAWPFVNLPCFFNTFRNCSGGASQILVFEAMCLGWHGLWREKVVNFVNSFFSFKTFQICIKSYSNCRRATKALPPLSCGSCGRSLNIPQLLMGCLAVSQHLDTTTTL